MESEGIKFLLSEEQSKMLQDNIYSVVSEAIRQAREDSSLDKRYLRKREMYEYLGISYNTLNKWITLGLPRIEIGRTVMFDKVAVERWLADRTI